MNYWKIQCHRTGRKALTYAMNLDQAIENAQRSFDWDNMAFHHGTTAQVVEDSETFDAIMVSYTGEEVAGYKAFYNTTARLADMEACMWCCANKVKQNCAREYRQLDTNCTSRNYCDPSERCTGHTTCPNGSSL